MITRAAIFTRKGAARVAAAIMLVVGVGVCADDTPTAPPAPTAQGLDGNIQTLKKDVMELNRDLLVLEEELLFPANTQVAVFLSMDVGTLFELDSVQVKVDNMIVTNYLYTEREVKALHRGGVQRLYLGNLKSGKHELVAVFTGKGPHERDYRRGATLNFEKITGPKYIELKIRDETRNQQPEFQVKEWQ
ncbi:MAG: AraC family transcriptional regulator [Gammaproteobacteria bacterium]|nr:AraC family transcriptional regulator [Gammaproteobacteria bacterium]